MSDDDSRRPRFREITESTVAGILATLVVAFLGLGGVTIGWLPTVVGLTIIIGLAFLWYKNDPGLQQLIDKRVRGLKQVISHNSDIVPTWNIVADMALNEVVQQNNLSRRNLQVSHRQLINIGGREHLELVIDYLDNKKWYALADRNGNLIDSYGGWLAEVAKCNTCAATVLVRFWTQTGGKHVVEPVTTCRRCNARNTFSMLNMKEVSDVPSFTLGKVEKHVRPQNGLVVFDLNFEIRNLGPSGDVCPRVRFQVAEYSSGKFIERIIESDFQRLSVPAYGINIASYQWAFPILSVVHVEENNTLKIRLHRC